MKLKIKRLESDAVIPKYAKEGDACFDLVATSYHTTDKFIEYGTGLAFEIPEGYVGLIFPRSSVTKKDLMLKNSVGVIDSGYRGEVGFRYWFTKKAEYVGADGIHMVTTAEPEIYEIGDRIGQMMIQPIPTVEFVEVDELTETDRGTGGYGHTGN